MRSKAPIINVRYESQAQVQKFKRAAKLCRWSLNTFLLAAGERYAMEVLSQALPATTQTISEIQQPTE